MRFTKKLGLLVACCLCLPALACEIPALPANTQVLIASDHTLPVHYGEASAGAEGRERDYIDPSVDALVASLAKLGVNSYVLNVEDQLCDQPIENKSQFNTAYERYDDKLRQAVAQGTTIVSLHFDADRLPPEASLEEAHYIGGIQLIVDSRAISPGTASITELLLNDVKILQQLGKTGLRLRPDYDQQLRMQNNQTLHIAGHSAGGAFLLELGSQRQARELFGEPDDVVRALKPSLDLLAGAIVQWREDRGKNLGSDSLVQGAAE